MLKARLLGTFELTVDGAAVGADRFERPSGLRLLKLLLATPGHHIRRESAAETLWPEADPVSSGLSLRKALHFARKALASAGADGIITGDGRLIALDAARLDVDVDRLQRRLDQVEAFGTAVQPSDRPAAIELLRELEQLGAHELLPDDPYEEWLVPLRERLRARALTALIRGTGIARELGERRLATALIDRALALDAADESAHRLAIQLYLDADQIHAARRQLVACQKAVYEAFAVAPSPQLGQLIEDAVAHRPAGARQPDAEPALIGRRAELEATEAAFDAVTAGSGAQIVLRGAAGIGKSRLLRELVRTGRSAGWRLVEARGVESAPDVAYGQIGPAIAGALTAEQIEDLPPIARSALDIVVPGVGSSSVALASDAALSRGLVEAVAFLADQPTMLVVDDVQWLDRPSLHLLGEMVGRLHERPVLLVLAAREDPTLIVGDVLALLSTLSAAGAAVIELGPLGAREVHVLLERDVPGERVDDELSAAIASIAAGAPLFALEIFRSARADGTLRRRDGLWQRSPAGDLMRATAGVTRLVEQRISQLDHATQSVLATAAELGDSVSFEVLSAAVDDSDENVLDCLDAAMRANLVVESGARYVFAHPLFRSALRQGLALRARGSLHARVALALSAGIDAADAGAIDTALRNGVDIAAVAAHAGQAAALGRKDVLKTAVGFGVVAGNRKAELFDYAAAAATLRDAIRWWHALSDSERSSFPISRAHVSLGRALRRVGDDPEARLAFEAAIATARGDEETAQAYSAAAWLPYEHGHFAQADGFLARGIASVRDPTAVAELNSERGWVFHRMGRHQEARKVLEQSVATLNGHGPSLRLMRALDRLGVVVAGLDGAAAGVPILERSLALTAEYGDTVVRAAVHIHLCEVYRVLRRFEASDEQVTQALELGRISGDDYAEAVALWVKAELEHSRKRFDEAMKCRQLELDVLARMGGNAKHEAMAHAHLALLSRRLGDEQTASAEAATARSVARHAADSELPGVIEDALAAPDWPPGEEGGNETGTSASETAAHG